MQSPPLVRFRNVPGSPTLEAQILDKVRKLERFHDRITACRVTLSSSPRHKHGGIFHVRIDLGVPGEEIVVDHESEQDPSHENLRIAIRDAFKAARRRLQDRIRRSREFDLPRAGIPAGGKLGTASLGAARVEPDRWRAGAGEVEIPAGPVRLQAMMTIPGQARALVICARTGAGPGRERLHRHLADVLHSAQVGTLSLALLTADERKKRQNASDLPLLARRLAAATRWAEAQPAPAHLRIGYFGTGAGASAALAAAASDPAIGAVVSCHGRLGLSRDALSFVRAPTLLIVPDGEGRALAENRKAFELLACTKDLVVLPGSSTLPEAPGGSQEIARQARSWFVRHLTRTDDVC